LAIEGENLILVVIAGVVRMRRAVPDDLIIPVAAVAGVCACVPLADLRSVVAVLAEDRRDKGAFGRIVRAAWIDAFHGHRLHGVLQAAGEQTGPRGHAPGAEIRAREADALGGQLVDVWRLDPIGRFGIAAQGLIGLIVGVDEQDVGSFGICRPKARAESRQQAACKQQSS
jgi:hypothetical protein